MPPIRPTLRACFLTIALMALGGCEGSNLFVGSETILPDTASPAEEAEPVLRFVEEGTLLQAPSDRLRFRWEAEGPIRFQFDPSTPAQERAAFTRALELLADTGVPSFLPVQTGGEIIVRALPPEVYRERDSTRPWSFSRTFVTASEEEGITEVEILVSLELSLPVLERAALHAMGHAMGIMGHPAFPGDRYVMAARPEDGRPIPTTLSTVERDALRFLYSPDVRAGMTLEEIREAYRAWSP
ncbi:MAG: hypothetical protein EA351_07655 [Gemmatimonadales bacterium]|nr:MAG: hypothetical protein EA351_07655 [Gemmatimonadales bacterium]